MLYKKCMALGPGGSNGGLYEIREVYGHPSWGEGALGGPINEVELVITCMNLYEISDRC